MLCSPSKGLIIYLLTEYQERQKESREPVDTPNRKPANRDAPPPPTGTALFDTRFLISQTPSEAAMRSPPKHITRPTPATPKTETHPATRNIFAAMPVTQPSA